MFSARTTRCRAVSPIPGTAVEAAPRGDIEFAADNGLDARFPGSLIKIDGAEEVAMVRDGQGRHFIFLRLLEQVRQADGTVQKAILRMDMKMNEVGWHVFSMSGRNAGRAGA